MGFEPKDPKEFDFKDIIYEKKDWVATVTINRPKKKNAAPDSKVSAFLPIIPSVIIFIPKAVARLDNK